MTEPSSSGTDRPSRRRPARAALFLLLLVGFAAAAGTLVMLLWNAVMVPVLGFRPLGFWQATGLLLLCRILFGAWSRPHRFGPAPAAARRRAAWAAMSPEQRARFGAHWKSGCATDASRGQDDRGAP